MSITVVIPTYNRASLVVEAVESALRQTRPPTEVLVIDDGSTDDTASALRPYQDRITYHRQSNRGVSAARNAALDLATGEYVAFLDSDDLWHPRKLELQVALLDNCHDIDLLFTDFDVLRHDGTRHGRGTHSWLPPTVQLGSYFEQSTTIGDLGVAVDGIPSRAPVYIGRDYGAMMLDHFGLTSTAIMRHRVVAEGFRFTEGISYFEDWEFYARITRHHRVGFADVETATNRGHRGTERLAQTPRRNKVRAYLGLLERVWKSDAAFRDTHGEAIRQVESRALLALARESVLANDREEAEAALRRWKAIGLADSPLEARLYSLALHLPCGSVFLRTSMRVKTLGRILVRGRSRHYSNNPAR